MSKKAVTLTELIIVIIIVGILAGLAMPQFQRAFEMSRSKEAVESLRQIRSAERLYYQREEIYWPAGDTCGTTDINSQFGLHLDLRANRSWDYSLTARTNQKDFTATAIRKGGPYDGKEIIIKEDGSILKGSGGNGWPLPIPNQ